MPLAQKDRDKLNTIIGKMKANNEDDSSIREMVSQFKAKYDSPAPGAQPAQAGKTGYLKNLLEPAKEYGKRFKMRSDRVGNLTNTEKYIPGNHPLEEVAAAPERAVRLIGGAIENLGELPITALSTLNRAAGGLPGKIAGGAAKMIGGAGAAAGKVGWDFVTTPDDRSKMARGMKYLTQKYKGLPQEVKDTAAPLVSIAAAVPVGRAIKPTAKALGAGRDVVKRTVGGVFAGRKAAGEGVEGLGKKILPKLPDLIPDIDEMAKKVSMTPSRQILTAKQVKAAAGDVPKGKFLTRSAPDERAMLSELAGPVDTPFTDYAVQARKAVKNMREATPMDLAGRKASQEVLPAITAIKRKFGKGKGKILAANSAKRIDLSDLEQQFKKLIEERAGLTIDKAGNIVPAPGRLARAPSEAGLIESLHKTVKDISANIPVKMADDAKAQIYDPIIKVKATQVKQINTIAEGIGKTIAEKIDNKLVGALGNEYKKVNRNYGAISKIEGQLNKRLGEIVDNSSGTARMGASLMKSAVQSNSDKGTKVLFEAIKNLTGYDLIREAGYAEIAMKAVGDARINSLLEDVGVLSRVARGDKTGAIMKTGEKIFDKVRGDKLDELIGYYTKAQSKKAAKRPTAAQLKKMLGNEKGGLGGRFSTLKPAIKSEKTGQIYTGLSHKQIFQQKIMKAEPNQEKTIWKAIFDDNTGKRSDLIGFVDKNGDFISRFDAEKAIANMSVIQQFHQGNASTEIMGLGAVGAGGTVGAIETYKHYRKKKKKGGK